MGREPYRDTTNLSLKSEKTGQSDVTHLMGQPQVVKRQPAPVKSDPDHPMINMSDYQKQLLKEIESRPEIMKLFKVIFQDYPVLVNKELRMTSAHSTNRQKIQGHKVAMQRLQVESWIEDQICKLAGIDTNKIAAENLDKPEVTEAEVKEAVVKEAAKTTKKTKKKTKKKVAKKTTKKKKTSQ